MKTLINLSTATVLAVSARSAADFDGSVYGNGTTTATSGENTITHFYDRAGIKEATVENIFSQTADRRSMPQKYGKTFKTSRWLHILDDRNVNGQGLDADGAPITGKDVWRVTTGAPGNINSVFLTDAEATAYVASISSVYDGTAYPAPVKTAITGAVDTNNGNQYGSSRDAGVVSAGMPSLTEGAGRVNRVGVTKITVETDLVRYGNFIEYSDEVDLFSEDSIQMRYREELGYMAGQIQDDLVQIDMLNAAGIVAYGGTAAARSALTDGDHASYDLFRKVTKQLFLNKAKKNTTLIDGSTKVDTRTINSTWLAYIGSDVKYDLESITDSSGSIAWVPAYKYAAAGTLAKGEVGAIHDTRFIESIRMLKFAGAGAAGTSGDQNDGANYDVFPILYVTEGSFATVGLQGKNKIMFKSKAPGTPTTQDPYGLRGLFSYNFFYAATALKPENIARVEVTASM